MRRLMLFLAALALVGCGGTDAATQGTGNGSFIATMHEAFPGWEALPDEEITQLGQKTCDMVEQLDPKDLDELSEAIARSGESDKNIEDYTKVVPASIVFHCPEWQWLLDS